MEPELFEKLVAVYSWLLRQAGSAVDAGRQAAFNQMAAQLHEVIMDLYERAHNNAHA